MANTFVVGDDRMEAPQVVSKEEGPHVATTQQVPGQPASTVHSDQPAIRVEHPQKVFEKKKAIFRSYQIAWYILGFIEVLLVFRMAFKLMGANPFSPFVSLIYGVTEFFVFPFRGILNEGIIATTGSVFEWSTLIAGVVIAIIITGFVHFLSFFNPVTPHQVEHNV